MHTEPAGRISRLRIVLLLVLLPVLLYLLYENLPIGQDWYEFFQPAAVALLHGQSPYAIKNFHNAPWTLLPFIPFALLPYRLGRLGIFVLGFAGFAHVAQSLKAKPVSMILFMTSFPVLACLYGGGLDWLPMLSFVMPAPVALIFAAMKPQIGFGIALFFLFESWQAGGIKQVIRTFLPVSILLFVSFALYGFWVSTIAGKWNNPVNISLFPYLLPLGVYLLYTRQKHAAMASSICFAPYFTFFTLAAPLAALLERPRLMFLAWVITWIFPIAKFFF